MFHLFVEAQILGYLDKGEFMASEESCIYRHMTSWPGYAAGCTGDSQVLIAIICL